MSGATLYAAETNTECLAATTTAEFWVVIKGVISYFIFRSASFLIARCYSVPAEIRQLWIPSVRFLLSLWWSHFHRVFPSNAYRRPSPPASPANWFFLSFFLFFLYIWMHRAFGGMQSETPWATVTCSRRQQPFRRKRVWLLLASFERQVHAGHRRQFTSHLLGRTGPGISSVQEFREKVLENKCEGVTFRARLIPPNYLFRVKL